MDVDVDSDAAHADKNQVYAQIARKNWLSSKKKVTRVNQAGAKALLDQLEKDSFSLSALAALEQLQTLESYLWPGYSGDGATDTHILLIALLINIKRRQGLPTWSIFEDRPDDFSTLFKRILHLSIDSSLQTTVQTHVLVSIIAAFQSLDSGIVRKECAPLVSISIWRNLHDERVRSRLLEENGQFKKAWRAANRRYDAADDEIKSRLRFERSWLYSLLLSFVNLSYSNDGLDDARRSYCERFLEFLIDLQSQFPTRRYVNTLLQDFNLLVLIKSSPLYHDEASGLFRDLFALLRHFTAFPLDDHTGRQQSPAEISQKNVESCAHLQRVALKTFREKLQLLILSNYGALQQRQELDGHLAPLTDEELKHLADQLGFRTTYPPELPVTADRKFLLDVLLSFYEYRPSFREILRDVSLLPKEQDLYEAGLLRNDEYDGNHPLALPKLNLQYLSTADFLWRSFVLYRCEQYYSIRKDLEETVKRLQPRRDKMTAHVFFAGSSRMACSIQKPAILDTIAAKVGEQFPSQVRAEIILDVSKMADAVRKDWEDLRPNEVIYLLSVQGPDRSRTQLSRGVPTSEAPYKYLRSAEVIQVQDEYSKPIRHTQRDQPNGAGRRPRQRRLIVKLDTSSYQKDTEGATSASSIYDSINVVVRRRNRENNFKPMLECIRQLVLSDAPMPSWLQDVFLGLGDPAGATYRHMADALRSVDFRDTFLDWQHLIDSLPDTSVKSDRSNGALEPPYVLEAGKPEAPAKTSKKRRREEDELETAGETITVSTYRPPNMGPYPADAPRLNQVRFTPRQVEAIRSGTQPGLTIVVGPPGTGKTDVATQVINNIYHNFPNERTLLVAHSNQALNQLFQKIVALDIDERHLLRLGHGEGELHLDSDASYSRHGRVESFLEIGSKLLAEVNRLAASLGAPGAHGNSCETADYFHSVYIRPAWTSYLAKFQSDETTAQQLMDEFPFHTYFYNAPQPLFPPTSDKETVLEVVSGCQRHIEKIFTQLEDIRPFEVLRHSRDRANYLLVKEARIIAMTSTHAAIHRQEISDLGFRYDNVVMEEAAQITEVENFVPLALQKPVDGEMPLKRVVMCGDHLQNSPIVQNIALRQYSNLDQSMFQRLVRLGVPTIMLDRQGRARPSIAELYRWRYPKLDNLPLVETLPEYTQANAGLRYDYQFVNVGDYKGKGETEPSPHFIQNLGEAEYVVATFMYMRLLGYPASKISILTTYAGQRALIRDVLAHRCARNKLFGLPRTVATVDKYQGEQNDYVLLSLVRTRAVGYLRDLRRLTVALSRARLGLYVFGRREVFEGCAELGSAFGLLLARPDKLALAVGEMHPTARAVGAEPEQSSEMEGVEHLGRYVFEMTQAKIQNLKQGREQLAEAMVVEGDGEDDEEAEERDADEVHGLADGDVDGGDGGGGEEDDADDDDAAAA